MITMLASHNTMTYKQPKQWWLRPFAFVAKCQSKDYKEQYDAGVRSYDIRVRKENGKIVFAHGWFSYSADDIDALFAYCDARQMRVRLMLETRHTKDVEDNRAWFKTYCQDVESKYKNIYLYGGRDMTTWEVLYDFGHDVEEKDYYSSTTALVSWCPKLDDWCPRIYAWFKNKEVSEIYRECPEDVSFLMDFV